MTGKDFWVIKFYAPWCGHCMRLEPEWIKFAKELDTDLVISVGEVNCVQQKRLEAAFGIQGYPTIVMYHDRKVWTYTKGRTADSLLAYFQENGPKSWLLRPVTLKIPEDSPILELRTPAEKEILKKAKPKEAEVARPEEIELAKAFLPTRLSLHSFTQTVKQGTWIVKVCSTFSSDCQSVVPKWLEAISKVKAKFGNEIRFGEIEASEDFSHQYRVNKIPTFLLFRDGQMFRYKKDLESIVSYIETDWLDDISDVISSFKIRSDNWTTSKVIIQLVVGVIGIAAIAYIISALIAWSNKSKSL